MKDVGHGANVEQMARMYNKNPKDIIDFSSNINPNVIQGLEEYILEGLQESRSYPDIKYTNLRNNISQYIDVRPEFIIPGNGATEIIYLLMKSIDKRIAILNPTFSEYERSARLNNLDVINLNLDESNEFEIDLNLSLIHILIASHSSAEPGTQRALKILNLEPVLNMGMRLGEGSGAALAFNIIEAANYTYENMATFDEVDMGR